jgi:hypothetical protein
MQANFILRRRQEKDMLRQAQFEARRGSGLVLYL